LETGSVGEGEAEERAVAEAEGGVAVGLGEDEGVELEYFGGPGDGGDGSRRWWL
jgi:hypothetical protein